MNTLTQEQLGQLIGVEKQCIGNYEQGARLPDLATLTRLGEVFNVDFFMSHDQMFFAGLTVLFAGVISFKRKKH